MSKSVLKNTKNKDLKVSVIIFSLNFGNYIEETISAILGQDYPNIELIVVDGNSTDGTVEVLKKFGNRITWISEPDEGQGGCCVKGHIYVNWGYYYYSIGR